MRTVAFDTETRGLDWFDPDQRAFLVSWADEAGSHHAAIDDQAGMSKFRQAIDSADRLVAHNLAFDVHQLRATTGIDLLASGKHLVDTDHLARVTLPERAIGDGGGYRLKDLAATYVGADSKDSETHMAELAESAGIKLKSNGGYYDTWRAYPEQVEHYAREDARITLELLKVLETKITERNQRCWDLERTVAPILISAEARGLAIDQEKVEPLRQEYERRAEEKRETVIAGLGESALDGSKALLEALLELGVPLHRKTPTGELATHKFALAEFAGQFPVLDDLLEWRTAEKFLSTYIGPMVGRDTVHPSFWQMGAWTGRMSCSRPNMQNIPARAGNEVREMIVPRPGHCFVVCDYDAIEIRLLAYYLNSAEYVELIDSGADPHAWMASKIWGGDPADYGKGTPGEKKRSEAKNVLFAIVYGAGGPRVADMLGIPLEESRALIRTIKTTLPRYLDLAGPRGRIRRTVETKGHVNTLMGRKQTVKRDKAYVGLNALIQGSAADIFKAGVIAATELCKPLDAHPVLFVHDELVMECPLEHADECLALTTKGMTEAHELKPRLAVSGCIAANNYAEGK